MKNKMKQNKYWAALLGCSALVVMPALTAGAATIAAKTSWAVSRVASASQGSYCTMAQKYSDDTVLTFARNGKQEYSLALDFQGAHFKEGKKQKISLLPQGGTAQSFTVTPQSDRTAVVSIGNNADLMKQIAKADTLKIDIDGKSLTYGLDEFQSGQSELEGCLSGGKAPAPVASGLREDDKQDQDNGLSAEGLLAAKPLPSDEMVAVASKVDVPSAAPVVAVEKDQSADTSEELESLRAENAKLTRAIADQRKTFEEKQAQLDEAALNETKQKLELLQSENKKLQDQLASQSKSGDDLQTTNQALEALKAENATLKNQIQIYAKAPSATPPVAPPVAPVDPELQNKLSGLEQENGDLKQQVSDLQMMLDSTKKTSSGKDGGKLAELAKENQDLKAQIIGLRQAEDAAASAMSAGDQSRVEYRKMKGDLDLAQSEKAALEQQVADLRKELEGRQLKMAGGSWDLEQATRRYQESQREIRRLGALLQSKDVKCANEKKEIEYMLFDPAIASKAQVAMLNSLEDEVKAKDDKLKAVEVSVQSAKLSVSKEKDAEIARLQDDLKKATAEKESKLAEMQATLASNAKVVEQSKSASSEQEKQLAQLKADLDAKSRDLQGAQTRLAQLESTQAALKTNDQALSDVKAQLTLKNNDLQAAQAKIAALESLQAGAQAGAKEKDQTLASVQAELTQKTAQLTDLQAKLAQATQSQTATATTVSAKDAEITALKTQLTQLQTQSQAQIAAERAKAEQINADAGANAKQSAQQAALLATLQAQVQQGNQKISELQNQIMGMKEASMRAAAVAPAAAPVPVAYKAPAAAAQTASYPSASSAHFKSPQEFSDLLKQAGISIKGSVQTVPGGDAATYRAYSWKTDSLYGSAELRAVSGQAAFDAGISQYLGRAKSRCQGEFAAVPARVGSGLDKNKNKAFEIACVGQNTSSSASVLFTYSGDVAMTIAHEGRAEAMDLAIDARDRVAGQMN